MIEIVGANTGMVYAMGTRAECFQKLQKKYPYKNRKYNGAEQKYGTTQNAVYPEPLKVVRR